MKSFQSLTFILCLCLLMSGCNRASDTHQTKNHHGHDHGHDHDHGTTRLPFDTLVVEIRAHRDRIKQAFADEKHNEAHDSLHEIGHLIGQLPDAAAETDLKESDWNQVKQASDKLMISFGKVDALFHGNNEGVKFADVEEEVEDAISILDEKVSMTSTLNQDSQP